MLCVLVFVGVCVQHFWIWPYVIVVYLYVIHSGIIIKSICNNFILNKQGNCCWDPCLVGWASVVGDYFLESI